MVKLDVMMDNFSDEINEDMAETENQCKTLQDANEKLILQLNMIQSQNTTVDNIDGQGRQHIPCKDTAINTIKSTMTEKVQQRDNENYIIFPSTHTFIAPNNRMKNIVFTTSAATNTISITTSDKSMRDTTLDSLDNDNTAISGTAGEPQLQGDAILDDDCKIQKNDEESSRVNHSEMTIIFTSEGETAINNTRNKNVTDNTNKNDETIRRVHHQESTLLWYQSNAIELIQLLMSVT